MLAKRDFETELSAYFIRLLKYSNFMAGRG